MLYIYIYICIYMRYICIYLIYFISLHIYMLTQNNACCSCYKQLVASIFGAMFRNPTTLYCWKKRKTPCSSVRALCELVNKWRSRMVGYLWAALTISNVVTVRGRRILPVHHSCASAGEASSTYGCSAHYMWSKFRPHGCSASLKKSTCRPSKLKTKMPPYFS